MGNRGRQEFQTDALEDHLSLDEIRMRMQTRPGFLTMQKWLVIYNFIVHPRPLSQIAMHTGLAEATVSRIVSEYNRLGPEAFDLNRSRPFHVVS
jgi:DNA-binding MarR family transcriptional regulator